MPARIKWLSWCSKNAYTEVFEQREELPMHQDYPLHPGVVSQFLRDPFGGPSKIVKDRQEASEDFQLRLCPFLRLLLADSPSIVDEVRLRSTEQVQVLLSLLPFDSKLLLRLSRGPGVIRLDSLCWLSGTLLGLCALGSRFAIVLHSIPPFLSFTSRATQTPSHE